MGEDRTFRIGDCQVEQGLDRISRGATVVTLRPLVMDVLVYLALQDGKIVHADDLLDNVWPGKVVTGASIYNCVSELRSAFQACDESQPYIETVPKRGYRLVAPVSLSEAPSSKSATGSRESLAKAARRKPILVFAALLALGLLATFAAKYVAPVDTPRLGPRSVLVLPFSGDQMEPSDVFADGLLAEILTQLSKVETLTTIGRATAMRYRDSDKSIQMMADESGVAAVMSGSLVKGANQSRFDVELLEARTGKTLWAESYLLPHAVEGLFRVQSDIAKQVANALQVELSPAEVHLIDDRLVTSQSAYEHYLRGEVYRQRTRLQEAVVEFEEATRDDPGFAAAWAALAVSRASGSFTGLAQATMEQAGFALEKAQELAPDAFETRLAEAMILGISNRFGESEELLQQLLVERPGSVENLIELSANNVLQLRLDQARTYAERAVELDPMNIEANWQLAFAHAWSWNFEQAGIYFDRALALEPESPHSWRFAQRLNITLWGMGDKAAARKMLDAAPVTMPTFYFEFQLAYVNRDLQKMQELLASIPGEGLTMYGLQARYYRLAGDVEKQIESAALMRRAAETELEALLSRGAPQVDVEDTRSEIAIAMALAGDEAEAIRTIERAVANSDTNEDRLNAVWVYHDEVLTYIFLGHYNTAIERLRALLSWARSPQLTPNRLGMDPDFDALRDHPGFESLLVELASGTI